MPQRRSPFSYSNGESTGAAPPMATPMTGSGTDNTLDNYATDIDPAQPGAESPATTRRRIMPIAGAPRVEPDALQSIQQMLARRQGGG